MKTLKIFMALLVLTTVIAKAQFTKAELQVSGLTCALCARATVKELKNLPFVAEIKTDFMRNLFIITFKNGEPVNLDQISKSVHDAGFFVSSLKATVNFADVTVAGSNFSYRGNTYQVMNAADKSLTGETAVTIVDKGFAPRSVSKKYIGQLAEAPSNSGRVYHVTI